MVLKGCIDNVWMLELNGVIKESRRSQGEVTWKSRRSHKEVRVQVKVV